jgi:hypothetical protein
VRYYANGRLTIDRNDSADDIWGVSIQFGPANLAISRVLVPGWTSVTGTNTLDFMDAALGGTGNVLPAGETPLVQVQKGLKATDFGTNTVTYYFGQHAGVGSTNGVSIQVMPSGSKVKVL